MFPENTASELEAARTRYHDFIARTRVGESAFRLTEKSESSPYALCFAIFGLQLLRDEEQLRKHAAAWDEALRRNLAELRSNRAVAAELGRDKPYLQLLSFTLSALSVIGTLRHAPLREEVLAMLPANLEQGLSDAGVFQGRARSGNHAMFMAILLLHAGQYLGADTGALVRQWVDLHLRHMNERGFWGNAAGMSHLQFQNGYHQYEILEYLDHHHPRWDAAAANVAALADSEGHFAPYPGGGGCYDYDAVFILTGSPALAQKWRALLMTTRSTILQEQGQDGGFAESLRIRPRSPGNLLRSWRHVAASTGVVRRERARMALTLQRPKHDRIHTHWTAYSRHWGESDLWDSWFRMLTVARIDATLDESSAAQWGFIDYPGIGFHPSVRGAERQQ